MYPWNNVRVTNLHCKIFLILALHQHLSPIPTAVFLSLSDRQRWYSIYWCKIKHHQAPTPYFTPAARLADDRRDREKTRYSSNCRQWKILHDVTSKIDTGKFSQETYKLSFPIFMGKTRDDASLKECPLKFVSSPLSRPQSNVKPSAEKI